jgi:hypothetical protein
MNVGIKPDFDRRTDQLAEQMIAGFSKLVSSVAGQDVPQASPECIDAHVLAIKVLKQVVTARHLMTTRMFVIEGTYPFLDNLLSRYSQGCKVFIFALNSDLTGQFASNIDVRRPCPACCAYGFSASHPFEQMNLQRMQNSGNRGHRCLGAVRHGERSLLP